MSKLKEKPMDDRETLEGTERAILGKLITAGVLTLRRLYEHGFRVGAEGSRDIEAKDVLNTLLHHGMLTLNSLQKIGFKIGVGEVVKLRLSRNERTTLTTMGLIANPDRGREDGLDLEDDAKAIALERLTVMLRTVEATSLAAPRAVIDFARFQAGQISALDVN